MPSEFNCEQCRLMLDRVLDDSIDPQDRTGVNAHLDECEECRALLAELWDLQALATRWREQSVPAWQRRGHFFESTPWLPRLQVAGAFASVLVLVLVLARVEVSTADGFTVRFGEAYATRDQLETSMEQLQQDQAQQLQAGIDRLTSQQVASNQLLLRTALDLSRQERREEMSNLVTLMDDRRDRRYRETEESLRYLVASQVEDRRNIRQLNQAIQLVASEGGTL